MNFRLCLIAASVLFAGCSNRASKLPRYAHVPAFAMTDQNGQSFRSSQLSGKVWIADFIYTNCPAECPMMTSRMKKLSEKVNPEVQLVSISVDPDHDTPDALKTFASRYAANWTFLTGQPKTVHLLAWGTFHVGDLIGKMEHSTKFALVDKTGVIRGYYSSLGEDGTPAILRDSEALRQDR